MRRNFWNNLIDNDNIKKEEIFLKIRDQYTALLKHLYDDPADIPDYRIHFASDLVTLEEGRISGYPITTVQRRTNAVTERIINDVTEIENYYNSDSWFQDEIFVVFDYRVEGITPLKFISDAFMDDIMQTLTHRSFQKLRINMKSEVIIQTGVMDFFYNYFGIDINFLQNLSAATYESSYADSRILVSRVDGRGVRRTRKSGLKVAFTEPVQFGIENLRQIRKMLELTSENIALVIGETGKIRGLTDDETHTQECEIRIMGHLAWTIKYDNDKSLSYNNGHYHIFVPHTADLNLHNFLSTLADPISEEEVEALSEVITEAAKQLHGTIVMIAVPSEIESETERICASRYAIGISKINLYENKDLINALTSIDGAVLMDTKCCCACIGAILDGDVVTKGSMARGARFNLAHNYVMRRAEFNQHFTAIVISEDGTVDAINEERIYRININRE